MAETVSDFADELFRLPMLVFDTCAFVAALYKGMQHLRNGSLKSSRLMRVLLRDSLAYFIMSVTSTRLMP